MKIEDGVLFQGSVPAFAWKHRAQLQKPEPK